MSSRRKKKSADQGQRQLGQYMTPAPIAKFMASRLLETALPENFRVLEPAAGSGNLVEAVFRHITTIPKKPKLVSFVLYEVDQQMVERLRALARTLRTQAKSHGFKVSFSIRHQDFLLNRPSERFDAIISNPPYFKVRKDDLRAKTLPAVIHGQPNIYGLFMAACADHLDRGGFYCFLTPRSWTSGSYFSRLREYLLCRIKIHAVHVFHDREAAFKADKIQQETMITWASIQAPQQDEVMISSSLGTADLQTGVGKLVPTASVFSDLENGAVIIPHRNSQVGVELLPNTFESIGLRASTGRVVPFRAKNWVATDQESDTYPLLWMSHVRRNSIKWPLGHKAEYFKDSTESAKLFTQNGNLVLVRRFSPRDSTKWIIAAPFISDSLGPKVAIENHLNVIAGANSPLSKWEAIGLALYINSDAVASYLDDRLGHTQINAGDLNRLPVPTRAQLSKMGREYKAAASDECLNQRMTELFFTPE
ncbi:HsdM family class I SAM-dependent methyltransferase [Roseateles chitinivorans]|uniref:HsdM family class I SAM-dependent methyltransferase n=1 Tax=Roseateles chitinivorans TaxID=2917965 RepID=UPI003D67AAF2